MFNRKSYKMIAKKQLKGRWTTAVLAMIVIYVIFLALNLPQTVGNISNGTFSSANPNFWFEEDSVPGAESHSFHYESETPSSSTNILLFIIEYFINGAIVMALSAFFVKMFQTTQKLSFGDFISGFSKCISGFLGLLWFTLWTALWSMLFVIPGIVKAFSYSQMFFVMADNPKIGVTKAMKISKIMTKGNKGELFVMALSFLGWDILSLFTLGILTLWIKPYKMMSYTNAYYAMKVQALKLGSLTPEDFEEASSSSIPNN